MSKPSISTLVGQIVRQHYQRCPFLVISGSSECNHNPCLLHFPSLFPSVSPCKPTEKSLCRLVLKFQFCSLTQAFFPPSHSASYAPAFSVFAFALCTPSSLLPALWFYCGLAFYACDWTVSDVVQGKPQLIKTMLNCESLELH